MMHHSAVLLATVRYINCLVVGLHRWGKITLKAFRYDALQTVCTTRFLHRRSVHSHHHGTPPIMNKKTPEVIIVPFTAFCQLRHQFDCFIDMPHSNQDGHLLATWHCSIWSMLLLLLVLGCIRFLGNGRTSLKCSSKDSKLHSLSLIIEILFRLLLNINIIQFHHGCKMFDVPWSANFECIFGICFSRMAAMSG